MEISRNLDEFRASAEGSAVTIGIFDGLHLGHRKVIEKTLTIAERDHLDPVLFTFSPGPRKFFSGDDTGHHLQETGEFTTMLASTGIATLVMIRFDESIREMHASEFLETILLGRLNARAMIVGDDFAFGVEKEGNVQTIERIAAELRIDLNVVPEYSLDGVPVRSSNIRRMLREGELELANRHLGYHFFVSGRVVTGAGKGRDIGSPTANLGWPPSKVKLPRGVYAVQVSMSDDTYPGVANFGVRPTFGNGTNDEVLEVHLLDCDPGQLHGESMRVSFVSFIREERKFLSAAELAEQIEIDIKRASEILKLDEAETERR